MSRAKLFMENFLVYGLGSIISKIVPLIMLPIITRLMPNTFYYGLSDISNVVVSFGSAIAIMGMYDAMFRMFFDKEDDEYKKDICSSAFYFTVITSIVIFIIIIVFRNQFAKLFFSSYEYTNILMISALSILVGSTNSIISAPTRMNNKRKVFLVTNTVTPIISYGISVSMLLNKMYIMALPLAALIASFTMLIVFYLLNHRWFSIKRIKPEYIKKMVIIGIPLVPNFLIYWIFNSCDRLMIGKLIGNDYVGIYGVGARLAQVSQFIYTAFAGGWQYFAFSTMNDDDQVQMTSNIFEYLGVISFAATIIMTATCGTIFKILFQGEYVNGASVVPYLFLSPLLLMLFQTGCNQFLVIKKTWPNMIILSLGAIINLALNYVLVPVVGIEGASIATLAGYVISVVLCVIVLEKYNLLKISKRFLYCSIGMLVYLLIWRIIIRDNLFISSIIGSGFIIFNCMQYREELNILKNKVLEYKQRALGKSY